MNRIALAILLSLVAAGCQPGTQPAASTPENQAAKAREPEVIVAVSPAEMAEGVILTPEFKWKLPPKLGVATNVSFTLIQVGPGEKPPKTPGPDEKQVAFCSGLADTSPRALDPFHPPAGCILTGDIRSMKELKAGTWFRWTIRAISEDRSETGEFLFKTRP